MKEQQRYVAGIYCRLSKDDDGAGDSSSILTQKSMLEKFVEDHGWTVYDRYIDDGYSGTNFNRPDFQRMIDDIEDGKINMVVVKDLSRLGRNYLLTGQYTEIYFPDRGVRFIALNDGIDTINSDNDIVPFKNILNEMYSKDISKKVRSAVRAKKLNGEYVSAFSPYGYMKDPANKNKLIIEESGAKIVRRIYEMCAGGLGTVSIAKILNKEGVLAPINHREAISQDCNKKPRKKYQWGSNAVITILRSRMYKGDLVQGTYDCARYKRRASKIKPKADWIITPNAHEPIIDEETWNYVQRCLNSRKRVMRNNELQLFAGFVKCVDCMAYGKRYGIEYYCCGLYRRLGTEYCTHHYINKKVLTQIVLDDIRKYARLAQEEQEEFAQHMAAINNNQEDHQIQMMETELSIAEARSAELDMIIKGLYEDSVTGKITDKRFQKLSAGYEAEQADIDKKIETFKEEIDKLQRSKRDVSAWLEIIKKYADLKELDRIVLGELIEKITVGETKLVNGTKHIEITIYYRFVGAIPL